MITLEKLVSELRIENLELIVAGGKGCKKSRSNKPKSNSSNSSSASSSSSSSSVVVVDNPPI